MRELLGKNERGKMYGFLIQSLFQHCRVLQTALAIRSTLDQQINLCMKGIQTDLELEDRIKKKVRMGEPTLVSSEAFSFQVFQTIQYAPYLHK